MLFAVILALWCLNYNHGPIAADAAINHQNMADPTNIWERLQDNEEVNEVDEVWQPLFDPPPPLDLNPNAPEE